VRNRPLETDGPSNKLLLLEGADDFHFTGHFLEAHGLDAECQLRALEGVENIKKGLRLELKPGGPDVIGIIVDADFDAGLIWKSLYNVLSTSGYANLPPLPGPEGIIVTADNLPRLGLWIMPDNRLPGMLEDFVKLLVPENDSLWNRALSSVGAIPEGERRFTVAQKAEIHTWLAWQEEPGTPCGQAIKKRYLNPASPNARVFLNWFRNLFMDADTDTSLP
jgi:hypothetical protein